MTRKERQVHERRIAARKKEEEPIKGKAGKTLHKQVLPYLNKIRERWLHKRVTVLTGKFAGREATVYYIGYLLTNTDVRIYAFVHIWKLKDPTQYVWSHPEARTSYNIDTQLKLIEES